MREEYVDIREVLSEMEPAAYCEILDILWSSYITSDEIEMHDRNKRYDVMNAVNTLKAFFADIERTRKRPQVAC